MTRPNFSIATPALNALEKLRRCVGSVRGQKCADLEHLIQDANSTDGTREWLSHQADLLTVSQPDGGMYDAINNAWARSSGEVLSWLNSDEQYLPGTLAKVKSVFDRYPLVDVISANSIVVSATGQAIAIRKEIPFRRKYIANSFLNLMSCTLFFRRRMLDSGMLYFDAKYRYAGDMDMMLRLKVNGVKMLHLPGYHALFGIDGSNLSSHIGMKEETREIQLKYGGSSYALIRQYWIMRRRFERLIRGAYWPAPCSYLYALDEVPNYDQYNTGAVGGRYSLNGVNAQRLE